jgi:hypothetical protein
MNELFFLESMTDDDKSHCPISEAKRALRALYLEVPASVADDVKKKVLAALHHIAYTRYVDLDAGANAVKGLFELSLVGPDVGFKPEDVARAVANAWQLTLTEQSI